MGISIHALLAESDRRPLRNGHHPRNFYPRSPCGERPHQQNLVPSAHQISIHALLAESDNGSRRRTYQQGEFLSTLSLRRATACGQTPTTKPPYFYPRSPCGERLHLYTSAGVDFAISIHALLAESDSVFFIIFNACCAFLSTLSLRRAT